MKRYKLLKWYPSLPDEWRQYKEVIVENDMPNLRYKFNGYYNRTSEIENNPDYWEEIESDPMFKTHDGVLYYNENDLVWDTHNFEGSSPAILSNPYFLERTEVKYARNITDRKFFSTKIAAENYRNNHIRCLSFKDVWNISTNKDSNNCYVIIGKSDLQKLIKERMPKL